MIGTLMGHSGPVWSSSRLRLDFDIQRGLQDIWPDQRLRLTILSAAAMFAVHLIKLSRPQERLVQHLRISCASCGALSGARVCSVLCRTEMPIAVTSTSSSVGSTADEAEAA